MFLRDGGPSRLVGEYQYRAERQNDISTRAPKRHPTAAEEGRLAMLKNRKDAAYAMARAAGAPTIYSSRRAMPTGTTKFIDDGLALREVPNFFVTEQPNRYTSKSD